MAPQSHVPAWKRAGLKLKRPQQYTDDLAKVLDSVQPPKKKSKKKHKSDVSQSGDASSSHLSRSERGDENTPTAQANANEASPGAEAWRGAKSVTFSQDAKLSDGPSQIPTSPPSPTVNSAANQDVETGSSPSDETTASNIPAHPGAKPTSRKYQRIGDKQPYLQYLETYCNNHKNWKFNKNLQSQLVASIYDVDRVPASYDRMLRLYLNRIQGAARWRLKEEAQQVLREIEEPKVPAGVIAESNATQAQDAQPAEQPSEAVQENHKRRRANLILSLFQYRISDRPTTLPPEQLTMFAQPQENEAQQTQSKRSRGRQRAAAANASDSSSSSSSDSDGATSDHS